MSSLLFVRAGAAARTTERARRLCILPSGPTPGCACPLPRRPAGASVFLDAGGRMTVVSDDGEDGGAQPERSLRRHAAGAPCPKERPMFLSRPEPLPIILCDGVYLDPNTKR